jgi:MoaA/NifB/PqqE/SkfB family radical SAM enzyme
MESEKYIVNSNYIIKNDVNRVFIAYRYHPILDSLNHNDADRNFFSFIHPDQAKILALFDGEKTISVVIKEIAEKLNTSKERAEMLVKPLIENKKRLGFGYKGYKSSFPQNIIVPYKEGMPVYKYSLNQFNFSTIDFKQHRLNNFPLDVTLMINTICCVDCIYCYADCRNKMDCQIPQDRLEKLISDCRKNDVRFIDLMGGEVLMYKNWQWLLKTMINYGYTPYVSTKMPIKKDIIEQMFELGIRRFQISLDSFRGEILEKNLNITNGNRYIENMRNTLKQVENIGMDLNIHAVITKHNKDLLHLQEHLENLSQFKNIRNVQFSIVCESLYKQGYKELKLSKDEVDQIRNFIDENKKNFSFSISFSSGMPKKMYCSTKKEKSESFDKRSLCSANIRQVFILPDGNVTICEELMFNPRFILGNLIIDDLKKIWDDNRLSCLFNKELHTDSRCGRCKKFDECKSFESRGVCWKEIFHAYGEDRWNYPDPKCPHSPKEMNKFYIE